MWQAWSQEARVDDGAHARLRTATRAAHDVVDAAFARFDLHARDGLAGFLGAHHAALAPLWPAWRRFVEEELRLAAPDYPAMLAADLAELEVPPPAPVAAPDGIGDAAVGYVVTGSRLGLATLARQGFWGQTQGLAGRYLQDDRGRAVWAGLRDWLGDQPAATGDVLAADAMRVFTVFAQAARQAG
ncbi:MAG: heme oxygenase [Sphingomonadales bacterium]|nr:heme oxygenase [Sphingomonadales bacterium]